MDLENESDFAIVAENLFPQDDTDFNFLFDITWKDKSSKLIINCREALRKVGNHNPKTNKIRSFTIPEFQAVHNELSAIEPKIKPYFPNEFTFKIIEMELPNSDTSWSFFGRAPKSIIKREREFSDETVESIKYYLRAVADICGQKLLSVVIFKEDDINYFENHDDFIKNESVKKIEQCYCNCKQLLKCHSEVENLQSLTEDLYAKQDIALEHYRDALSNHSLMNCLPLREESEDIKEKLEKVLLDLQWADMGSKKISELKSDAETYIQLYYDKYRNILTDTISLSKKQRGMYFKYLTKMLEDKRKYQPIIFRECAGQRMGRLSTEFYKENEKIAQLNLDLHSSMEIVVIRKIELIRSWKPGQEMVRANVRHEDVSLIQLKHLDTTNIETSLVDDYYSYIKETIKLLLEYSESQRLSLQNRKQITDDPLNVVLPSSRTCKPGIIPGKTNESSEFIDYSWVVGRDSDDSDFEDALNEEEFGELKKNEIEKINIKRDCDNKLKEIANKRADLRISKAKLDTQYEKLMQKASEMANDNFESLHFESLHPENHKLFKKPVSGGMLSLEQRKEEGRKARARIKQYQEKLRVIPEDNVNVKNGANRTSTRKNSTKSAYDMATKVHSVLPDSVAPIPPPPPAPPPLPPVAPPPPSSQTLVTSVPIIKSTQKVINAAVDKKGGTDYLTELKMAFAKKKTRAEKMITIDEEILSRKVTRTSNFNDTLSSLIDNRRQFFKSDSQNNSDDENN